MVQIQNNKAIRTVNVRAVATLHSNEFHGRRFVALIHVVIAKHLDFGMRNRVPEIDARLRLRQGVAKVAHLHHDVDVGASLNGISKCLEPRQSVRRQPVMKVGDNRQL